MTEQSVTTETQQPSVSFTGIWKDLTHGDYKQLLSDIKTEAEAAIASGEPTIQKWARTAGTFASLLGVFLEHTNPGEFNKLVGVVEEGAEAFKEGQKEAP